MRSSVAMAVLVSAGLIVAGCGAADADPTTAVSSTPAPTTGATTAAPPSTAATTIQTVSKVETRPEILMLALPTYGGGSFDPDSVAGKNVILWFWGAY